MAASRLIVGSRAGKDGAQRSVRRFKYNESHHCRRRCGRACHRADAACARHRLRDLRAGRRDPRARRRHQHAAARDQGAEGARAAGAARRGRDPHLRAVLPQPLRAGDLERKAWARCGLRRPAVLDPPRQTARRDLSGGACTARREPLSFRIAAGRLHAGRWRRHRLFLRPQRLAPHDRARRRADRRRRHPLVRARQALSRTKARRPGTA